MCEILVLSERQVPWQGKSNATTSSFCKYVAWTCANTLSLALVSSARVVLSGISNDFVPAPTATERLSKRLAFVLPSLKQTPNPFLAEASNL